MKYDVFVFLCVLVLSIRTLWRAQQALKRNESYKRLVVGWCLHACKVCMFGRDDCLKSKLFHSSDFCSTSLFTSSLLLALMCLCDYHALFPHSIFFCV